MKKLLSKIIKLLFKKDIESINYTIAASLYGTSWTIPVMKGVGTSHNDMHEEYLFKVYKQLLQTKTSFIDIGANLGQTIIKVKSIKPKIPYTAFEPSNFCVEYINKLVEFNILDNIQIVPSGLSNSAGIVSFYSTAAHSQGNSIVEGIRVQNRKLKKTNIPVYTLDELSQGLNLKDDGILMKVDVEGAESMVLEGMKQFISENKPTMLFEFLRISEHNEEYIDKNVREKRLGNQVECEAIFKELEYDKYLIHPNGSFELMNTIGFNNNPDHTNYLLIPNTKKIEDI